MWNIRSKHSKNKFIMTIKATTNSPDRNWSKKLTNIILTKECYNFLLYSVIENGVIFIIKENTDHIHRVSSNCLRHVECQ